jgi:hypothetical protein
VKPSLFAQHSVADDRLAINQATLHQYYSTVQAEAPQDDLLDEALNRRQLQALMQRHHQGQLKSALGMLAMGLLLAGVAWLLFA